MAVARGSDRRALRAVAHRGLRRFLPAHQDREYDQLSGAGAPALQGQGRRDPGAVLSAAAARPRWKDTEMGDQDPRRPPQAVCEGQRRAAGALVRDTAGLEAAAREGTSTPDSVLCALQLWGWGWGGGWGLLTAFTK